MRALRLLVLLPILAILAGCFGSAPPGPKEQYFRLVAAQPAEEASRQISGGIEIVPFAGEGVMSERPLLFSADGLLQRLDHVDGVSAGNTKLLVTGKMRF